MNGTAAPLRSRKRHPGGRGGGSSHRGLVDGDRGSHCWAALYLYPDIRADADAVVVPHLDQTAATVDHRNHTAPTVERTTR